MKQKIKKLLEDQLPLVDLDSERLYDDLDSLGVTTILMTLSEEFDIELDTRDATPNNLRNLDALVALVEKKLAAQGESSTASNGTPRPRPTSFSPRNPTARA